MAKGKILIADDEVEVLEILARKVRAEGYEVVTAQDGQEALDKIYSESPDVILLDIRMPKMDGFEVLKRLKGNPIPGKWQPVIIISALADLEDVKKGYNLEADHYLVKPCDIWAIIKGIDLSLIHI